MAQYTCTCLDNVVPVDWHLRGPHHSRECKCWKEIKDLDPRKEVTETACKICLQPQGDFHEFGCPASKKKDEIDGSIQPPPADHLPEVHADERRIQQHDALELAEKVKPLIPEKGEIK